MEFAPVSDNTKNQTALPEHEIKEQSSAKEAGEAALKAALTEQKRPEAQATLKSMGLAAFSIHDESNTPSTATPKSAIETVVAAGNEIPKIVGTGNEIPKIKWRGPDGVPPITGHFEIPKIPTRPGEFK